MGLDRIDSVSEELWTEVRNTVVIKTNSKNKKCNKGKWFSEEGLKIAKKRREVKGKEEKE